MAEPYHSRGGVGEVHRARYPATVVQHSTPIFDLQTLPPPPMAELDMPKFNAKADIYSGIISPQGGIFEPGPPVMLPPQGTDKGAAITRALIASSMDDPGLGPSGGGGDAWGNFQGFRDDTPYDVRSMAQIGAEGLPHAAGTLVADKGQERLPPGSVLAFGDASTTSPAQQAIAAALLSGTTPAEQALEERAFGGGAPLGGDMQWSPAETAPAPSGDTWLGMREPGQTGALVARPGMVTSNRPIVGFHPQHRTSVAGGSAPGARFLNEQGVDTSHMTPGQLANALNKAIF